MQLYPEIYACIGCNACTKSCTQELNVMQYIAYAQRGDFEDCAEESFDCVMCGVCSSRCPAGHFPSPGGHAGPAAQRQVSDCPGPSTWRTGWGRLQTGPSGS